MKINKFRKALGPLFLLSLPFSTPLAFAEGGGCDDNSFFPSCILKKEEPDFLTGEWVLAELDKLGDAIPSSIADALFDSAQDAAVDFGLDLIKDLLPGFSVAIGILDPGANQPSETELWAKRIITVLVDRIDTAEANIKDEMYAIIQEQTSLSVETVLLNIQQHANLSSVALKRENINRFGELLTIIQNSRLEMQSEVLFNHYDSYHAYLNVVSLELAMTLEYYTTIYRMADESASDVEIAQLGINQLKEVLYSESLGSSVFEHISKMNNGDITWRSESDFMFPVELSDLESITYVDLTSTNPEFADLQLPANHIVNKTEFTYLIEGVPYTFKKLIVHRQGNTSRTIVMNHYGDIYFDKELTGQVVLINADWMNSILERHKYEYYIDFLKRGYEPSRRILDSWWLLGGKTSQRPEFQADLDLMNDAGKQSSASNYLLL